MTRTNLTPGQWRVATGRINPQPITAMFGDGCRTCDWTGHVCSDDGTGPGYACPAHPENTEGCPTGHHGDVIHPWDGLSGRADACDCGGGAPCPRCSPEASA